jgi:hypothetical protein
MLAALGRGRHGFVGVSRRKPAGNAGDAEEKCGDAGEDGGQGQPLVSEKRLAHFGRNE